MKMKENNEDKIHDTEFEEKKTKKGRRWYWNDFSLICNHFSCYVTFA